MTTTDELELLALDVPCNRCGAPSGYWCQTRTGNTATSLHTCRTHPVFQAWGVGYEQGRRDSE